MSLIRDMKLARAPMAGLAAVGVFWGGFAGLMPDIKAIAGVSDGQFGMAMMLSALGSLISMFLSPRYVRALARWAIAVTGVLLLVAFHLPIFASSLGALGMALFFMGATVGMLDICSNIRVSALESRHDRSLMNVSHAMFSFAFGIAAVITGMARGIGMGPAQILPGLAGMTAVLVILTIEKPAAWQSADDAEAQAVRVPSGVSFWPVVLLSALVLFASFIGENSTEAWSALHIERTLGAEVGHGSYGPAILGFVMGFGRLFGQAAVNRVGERRLIIGSAALGVIGALVIAGAWAPYVVYTGVGVIALGMAIIVPSANTVLGRRVPPSLQGLALSRAWMVGMSGFFIGPSLMGLVSEVTSLRVSYLVVAGIVALIIPAILAIARIPTVDRPAG